MAAFRMFQRPDVGIGPSGKFQTDERWVARTESSGQPFVLD